MADDNYELTDKNLQNLFTSIPKLLFKRSDIMSKEFTVTPWEVKGDIDYDKLIEQFGTKHITKELLERIRKHTKDLHYMLRRKIFFSHRDFDWILDKYDSGQKFALYTGRKPSGPVHLGHLSVWMFTKWLQDKFDVELYFEVTNDENFLFKDATLEESTKWGYDNALDVIALGFNPKKTFIFLDTEYAKTLYGIAVKVAKHVTFSTVKGVFGFTNENNIGSIFYPAIQASPCFLPSVLKGHNVPVVIPAAIDQDNYWRMTRDLADKLGYYKPSQIHSTFLPGLLKGGKMSASEPNSAIFTTDSPEVVEKKIMNAFTGQQPTAELQKKLGGNPDICSVCQYYFYLFEESDKKVQKIFDQERNGEILAGEHKADLSDRTKQFIVEHQKKRERAKSQIEKFMLRD